MPKIEQLRRHLVETEAKFPEELLNLPPEPDLAIHPRAEGD